MGIIIGSNNPIIIISLNGFIIASHNIIRSKSANNNLGIKKRTINQLTTINASSLRTSFKNSANRSNGFNNNSAINFSHFDLISNNILINNQLSIINYPNKILAYVSNSISLLNDFSARQSEHREGSHI